MFKWFKEVRHAFPSLSFPFGRVPGGGGDGDAGAATQRFHLSAGWVYSGGDHHRCGGNLSLAGDLIVDPATSRSSVLVIKLNPQGSAFLYQAFLDQTTLGGSGSDHAGGIAVDSRGFVLAYRGSGARRS